jgi:very-short-patch-repair endonuclease
LDKPGAAGIVASVARKPYIPPGLTKGPFTLEEARAAGLTLSALRGRTWRRIGTELYCASGWDDDPWQLLKAWQETLPEGAVFAGNTAAWLWGLDLEPTRPIEVIVPVASGVRTRAGLNVRRCSLQPRDATRVRGLRVTTLTRTLSDLCRQRSALESLVALDMALRIGLLDRTDLSRHHSRKLRSLAALAAPAESPMETRLRWLMVESGLPMPEVQVDLKDDSGRFVGRADLYYPSARLAIEFDGGNHRERLVEDDRRQNLLMNAGYRLLRFTGADLLGRPNVVRAQVRDALLDPNARNSSKNSALLGPKMRNGTRAAPGSYHVDRGHGPVALPSRLADARRAQRGRGRS